MMHRANRRTVADSTPDEVIRIIDSPFSHSVAVGWTQPIMKMRTMIVSWGKGDQCVRLTTSVLSCADFLELLEASKFWSPKGLSRRV